MLLNSENKKMAEYEGIAAENLLKLEKLKQAQRQDYLQVEK